ncbi:MAG: hypothetical protein US54_C0066G0007 [Candidatus Roizmanbacteria bacterium GW2011_GWA2_37_7]|uniref:Uncharacterized protein n=1 Tax=Candidatus Roizmanbacteria bacterium GW2011_GWA2_37_7 TaxID=1618481 RepID=A0A0G0GZS6_9BACT|nr:MAG: hypothetical protein US54_C0066G0007 [Candidatus Roizmanbacteria bacterium GW2011_GWA2_37_7]
MGDKHKKSAQTLPATLPANEKLKFSFEYYDKISDKYCLSSWQQREIRNALLRLQDICTKSYNDLARDRKVYHFYEVVWEKTIKKTGFPDKRLEKLSAFHFALLGINNQKARVFGAYSTGTFYIVWFDFNHEIWPVELKHT